MRFKRGPEKPSVVRLRSDFKEYARVLADMLCKRLREMESDKFIATWAWSPWWVHVASLLYVTFAYRFWNAQRNGGDREFQLMLNDEVIALARGLDPKQSWSEFGPLFSDLDRQWWSDLFDLHCFPDGEDRDQQRIKSDANKEYICKHFLSNEAREDQLEAPIAAVLAADIRIRTVLTVMFAHINKSLSQGSKMPTNKSKDLRQRFKLKLNKANRSTSVSRAKKGALATRRKSAR